MDNVTACIKTFMRPACLGRLVDSLKKNYPDLKILICDDSKEPYAKKHECLTVKALYALFDSGLGSCRNLLVNNCETDRMIMFDDDMFIDSATNFSLWEDDLSSGFDLVGGQLIDNGVQLVYHGDLDLFNGHLEYISVLIPSGVTTIVDITHNFFMAAVAAIKKVMWDPSLKLCEHTEFFLRAQGVLKVGQNNSVIGHHLRGRSFEYDKMRDRAPQFTIKVNEMYGITKITQWGKRLYK